MFWILETTNFGRKLLNIREDVSLNASTLEYNLTSGSVNNSKLNQTENTVIVVPKNCTKAAILEFPSDGFSRSQRRHGWIVLHIALACYCFWLLAIVCDDYFVPAMESMCFCKYFYDFSICIYSGIHSKEFFVSLIKI